ncbi:hypothetical protein ACFUC1_16765 [Pedococcus sp. NPDC057267]|uniref:hypothetical protein n=1 Tax=Pedococcus sp. NPDC057267 TaxID=3346077 RepID=UPI0036275A52
MPGGPSPSLTGFVGHSRPWARRAVRLASLGLPRGEVRDRYRREFVSDLSDLGAHAQVAYCVRVVVGVPALRLAVRNTPSSPLEPIMATTTRPLRCRLTFHRWEAAHTPDGQRFDRCARCHKERGDGRTGFSGLAIG